MTRTTTAVREITQAEMKEDVDALLDAMAAESDEHWEAFASQIAAATAAGMRLGLFKVWSVNNRLFLAAQVRRRRSHVHHVFAGVDQWRKLGRAPREGEEPYTIYGPPGYLARPDGDDPNAEAVLRFRRPPVIRVYDYTQTAADDPEYVEPDWAVPLAGGDLATLQRLADVSPVPVTFADVAARLEHGWLDDTGITVDASRSISEQVWTLAHELGHYQLGHLDQLGSTRGTNHALVRAKCEQEAALTQFFVMKMLGLDERVGVNITAAAGQYLRTWVKDNPDGTVTEIQGYKGRRKLLRTRMDAGLRAASAIVTAYVQGTKLD